ncbi:type II toxin-antitoxin system VapC family toxin [Halosimplex sp. TS25]|uniref:type II toxin-antitoxin system VapC family toxin n=1 Tax=Halosimplex rarum TaxID=3396619 RepID=UPI0039ED1358
MSGPGTTPLFVDTGALYARFDDDDQHHDEAVTVFRSIAAGNLVYRPLYVNTHVLAEFATLTLQYGGPVAAARAVQRVRDSALFTVVHPSEAAFEEACQALERYDDQEITLVDHLTGVLAERRDIEFVFTFDSDFQTLGFTTVPAETGDVARFSE